MNALTSIMPVRFRALIYRALNPGHWHHAEAYPGHASFGPPRFCMLHS